MIVYAIEYKHPDFNMVYNLSNDYGLDLLFKTRESAEKWLLMERGVEGKSIVEIEIDERIAESRAGGII